MNLEQLQLLYSCEKCGTVIQLDNMKYIDEVELKERDFNNLVDGQRTVVFGSDIFCCPVCGKINEIYEER